MKSTESDMPAGEVHDEGIKLTDILTVTTASVSMIIVAITLVIVFYVAYRIREDVRFMERLEIKLVGLDKNVNERTHVSAQLLAVLYDLHAVIAAMSARQTLESGGDVSEELKVQIEGYFWIIGKHFSEIELLADDKEIRLKAQKRLANATGDFQSLELMQKIDRGDIGCRDEEVRKEIRQLKTRMTNNKFDSSKWTGMYE